MPRLTTNKNRYKQYMGPRHTGLLLIPAPGFKTVTSLLLFLFCTHLTVLPAQNTGQEVFADKGDGIHTLLQKNGFDPAVHTSPFIELNKSKLGSNRFLIEGAAYTLPAENAETVDHTVTESRTIEYPLFGETYSTVTILNHTLKGAVYYLIAGHGGPDPGAVTRYGQHTISEHEYAYDVTLRLARRLMEHGAQVYMIVNDPESGIQDEHILAMDRIEVVYPDLAIPLNQKARLMQRTNAVNKLSLNYQGTFQRLIEIHLDSRSESQNIDVFFYHHHNSRDGERLANNIHQTFSGKYALHQPSRGYSGTVSARSGLFTLRHTNPPAILIELGNIQNSRDQPRFIIPENRQAMANWIVEGVIADYNEQDNVSAMN